MLCRPNSSGVLADILVGKSTGVVRGEDIKISSSSAGNSGNKSGAYGRSARAQVRYNVHLPAL